MPNYMRFVVLYEIPVGGRQEALPYKLEDVQRGLTTKRTGFGRIEHAMP